MNFIKFIISILFLGITASCSRNSKEKLEFRKFPNLKLGFTTQNFIECTPVTSENAKKFIDYAVENRFHWIELRDPDAVLTFEECKQIAGYANKKGIEIGYANQRGFLDPDFWEIFSKGVKNAAAFNGPNTIRALISGKAFSEDENKLGLDSAEFKEIIDIANKAAGIAKENGLQLVVENGAEAFFGDNKTYFGTNEFFQKVNSNVGWQFDTGNPFSGARVKPSPDMMKQYLMSNIKNLYYIHLKSAQNGEALTTLQDNDLDFDVIFSALSEHDIPYIAIELSAIDNKKSVFKNHEKSIQYLKRKRFIE